MSNLSLRFPIIYGHPSENIKIREVLSCQEDNFSLSINAISLIPFPNFPALQHQLAPPQTLGLGSIVGDDDQGQGPLLS